MRSLGLKGFGFGRRGGVPRAPVIRLSSSSIAESASIGSAIGLLSVRYGNGTYTFTEVADPDNKFAVDGTALKTAAALDYETATSHSVTVQADNGVDEPITETFTIAVLDIPEDDFTPSMTFSDARNSQYVPILGGL